MYKLNFFCSLLILCTGMNRSFAQQQKIDSPQQLLKTAKEDTNKVNILNELAWQLSNSNPDTAIILSTQALSVANIAIKGGWQKGIANSDHNLGWFNYLKGNHPLALEYSFKALKIREALNNKIGVSKTLGNIGVVYWNQSNYPKALSYFLKALKIAEDLGDKNRIAIHLGNIGLVYTDQADYSKALYYYFKALKMDEDLGDKNGVAADLGNIGAVYNNQGDSASAKGNKNFAIADKYPKALDYFFKALKMAESLGDKNGVARHLGNIGALYLIQAKFPLPALRKKELYNEAEKYLQRALALDDSVGALSYTKDVENNLYDLYCQKGKHQLALQHYKKFIAVRDSIFNKENTEKTVRSEMNFEFDKKEAISKAEQERQAAIAEAESKRQKLFLLLIACVTIAMAVIAIVVFRSLRVTKKQKSIIEEKNIQITDSIEYARNIQQAILPSLDVIQKTIPDSFILFLPKDVVSGDFYWINSNKLQDSDNILVAAVDCTGHGVPGAFMSVMAFNMLENIIARKKTSLPSLILDELNTAVIETLHQESETSSAKYGMDIALVNIDKNSSLVHYAGAHNSLCLVRENQLLETKADKATIGMAQKIFTNHTLEIKKGDMLYIFSDGFADQKGGPQNKKFFAAPFRELLTSLSASTVTEQKEKLLAVFTEWKNANEQMDDILIIGIRM